MKLFLIINKQTKATKQKDTITNIIVLMRKFIVPRTLVEIPTNLSPTTSKIRISKANLRAPLDTLNCGHNKIKATSNKNFQVSCKNKGIV